MIETITSTTNKKAQHIKSLLKNKPYRYEHRQFVVEGVNIVKDIPQDVGFELYYTAARYSSVQDLIKRARASYELSERVMDSVCDTVTPSGMLAVADMKEERDSFGDRAILLDGLSDPGNMGTIIRTAVALGIEDVLTVNSVDVYSPKVVRSSMGGIFNASVTSVSYEKALELIRDHNVYILDMNGENVFDRNFTANNEKFVLAVGSESRGVSDVMRNRADRVLSLPMSEKIESLNAGVSLTAALYRILYL